MALTDNDARIVLGMISRGDKHHDIAAWFGENQARVAEVEQGKLGTFVAATRDQLPPKGAPGPKGRRLRAFVLKALAELDKGNAENATKLLKEGIQHYDRNEA